MRLLSDHSFPTFANSECCDDNRVIQFGVSFADLIVRSFTVSLQ